MRAVDKAEVIRQLEEAFDGLMDDGTDTTKVFRVVGASRYLIASALVKLGRLGPMARLDQHMKEALSNSAAPIGPSAAKESAPVVPSFDGERGVTLPAVCTAGSEPDQSKSAQS